MPILGVDVLCFRGLGSGGIGESGRGGGIAGEYNEGRAVPYVSVVVNVGISAPSSRQTRSEGERDYHYRSKGPQRTPSCGQSGIIASVL
jgi:hypothetical protein